MEMKKMVEKIKHLKSLLKKYEHGEKDRKKDDKKDGSKHHPKKEDPKAEKKRGYKDPIRHEKAESTTDRKFKKVLGEFKEGDLHSGSKKGPVVSNPKQAVAIAYSEARKAKKK